MDPKTFLNTALFLCHHGNHEAEYRSAISRAYYACFLTLQKILYVHCNPQTHINGKISKETSHRDVATYISQAQDISVKKIGIILKSLRGNRKDADYKMGKNIVKKDAEDAIYNATTLFNSLSNISPTLMGREVSNVILHT